MESGTGDRLEVDTVVLIETLILAGDEGQCQVPRDGIPGYLDAVRVHADIAVDLIPFAVINDGGLSGGDNVFQPHAGRVRQDPAKHAET